MSRLRRDTEPALANIIEDGAGRTLTKLLMCMCGQMGVLLVTKAYEQELAYELELMRAVEADVDAPRIVRRLLIEIAEGIVDGKFSSIEKARKIEQLRQYASILHGNSNLLERFKWTVIEEYATRENKPEARREKSEWEIRRSHSIWDTKLATVRAECPFLEPYLCITLSELEGKIAELEGLKVPQKQGISE
jgi:hypothetical protein